MNDTAPGLRHALQILRRLALAAMMAALAPLSHLWWGQPYPGEGQKSLGMLVTFFLIGMVFALAYLVIATVLQFALAKRRATLFVRIDIALWALLSGLLAYGGITARYLDYTV